MSFGVSKLGDSPDACVEPTGAMSTLRLQPGASVLDGRFRVVRQLAGGGMGEVYLAEQVSLGRAVALKVLRTEMSLQPAMLERFKREARLLSAVEHPSVVRVIDFGETQGSAFLVMELVEGETLEFELRRGALDPQRALRVLSQLSEGLEAIHAKNIVHRDLKPENVVLTHGPSGEWARLLDFGIARVTDASDSGVTQAGMVLGTPDYLSPEQALGGVIDARSDIYSFGVLAYRCLTGKLPFPGPGPRDFLLQHAAAVPAPILTVAPALHARLKLAELVMSCLSKDPSARPASASELSTLLAACSTDETAAAIGTSGTGRFGAVAAEPTSSTFLSPAARGGTRPRSVSESAFRAITGSSSVAARAENLVVMLTDLKGFTARTSQQTREENARMLEQHDSLLIPVARAFGGRLIQKRGDALLLVFRSPTEAVHCGMAMQDRLWRHNQLLAEREQLHIRVMLHVGEVIVAKDGLIGAPASVVTAVEARADADEVVFTEAVNLAMNRAEVSAEPCGELEVPGRAGETLKLYRCRRDLEGPPFGGQDTQVLASSPAAFERLTGLASRGWVRVRDLTVELGGAGARGMTARLDRASGGWSRLTTSRRAGICGIAAAIAVAWIGFTLHERSPAVRARRFLDKGLWPEALIVAQQAQAEGDASAAILSVEARALHRLGRHGDELSLLETEQTRLGDLDDEVVLDIAEDFGRSERSSAIRDVLARLSNVKLALLTRAAGSAEAPSQWGALRFLDSTQALPPTELVRDYRLSLQTTDCRTRGAAARRLGELGQDEAAADLERLSSEPKKRVLFLDENCGQDEANNALRKIRRARDGR